MSSSDALREWETACRVAAIAPTTGMVPVKSSALIAINAELDRLRAQVAGCAPAEPSDYIGSINGVLLKLRAMADDAADRGDVFAQRVVRLLDAAPSAQEKDNGILR